MRSTLEATLIETVPSPDALAITTLLRRHYEDFLDSLQVPAEERLYMTEALYPTPVKLEERTVKAAMPVSGQTEVLSTQGRSQGI
jgi:hypothetical protein